MIYLFNPQGVLECVDLATEDKMNSLTRGTAIAEIPFSKMGNEFKRSNRHLFKVFDL